MILIKYKDHNSIEGYVKTEKDFIKWLDKNNRIRRKENEIIEYKNEFELIPIENLNEVTE